MITNILSDLEHIRADLPKPNFGLVYGSHACDAARPDSDIDLMFFVANPPQGFPHTVSAVIELHHKYGSALDLEVPYENKLIVSYDDASRANKLEQFTSNGREMSIPRLEKDTSYMNSTNMRLRLVFNALTSPHIFVGGDAVTYSGLRFDASKALASLAIALSEDTVVSKTSLMTALKRGNAGQEGEDHLGYKNRPTAVSRLWSSLSIGMKQLEEIGWVVARSPNEYEVSSIFPYQRAKQGAERPTNGDSKASQPQPMND